MKKQTNMDQSLKGNNGKMPTIFHVEASFCQPYVAGLRRLTTEGAVIDGKRFSELLAKLSFGKSKVERCGKISTCGGQEGSFDAHQEVIPPVQGASSSRFDDWPSSPIGKPLDGSKHAVSKHEVRINHAAEKSLVSNVLVDLEPPVASVANDDGIRSASAAEEDALWNDLVELESEDKHTAMPMEIDATVVRHEDQESGISSFEETEGHKSNSEDEKNGGDDDEFKHIWEDAEFVLACVKQSQKDKEGSELHKEEVDECDHKFDFIYSLGNVCRLCQLISDDVIEHLSFTTSSLKRRKRQQDADEAAQEHARALANLSSTILAAAVGGGEESAATPLWIDPSIRSRMHGHQQEGFDFLQRNLARRDPAGCILAHAPGTGKTFLVITFLQSFLSSFPETRPLIVAPNSMLSVWEGEFRKWGIGDIQVLNLLKISATDYRSRRIHQLSMLMQWESTRSTILLVSYMTLSRMVMGKVRNIGDSSSEEFSRILCRVPGLLVMDEGHNARTKETELLKALSRVSTKRRILLSGTLFQNSFTELYNMYRLVRPDFMAGYSGDILTQTTTTTSATLMELRLFEKLGRDIMSEDRNVCWQAIRQIRLLSEPLVHYYKGQLLEGLPGLVDLILVMNLTGTQQRILDEQSIRKQQEQQQQQQNQFIKKGNKRKSTRESAMSEDKKLTKLCIHPACLMGKAEVMGREDPEDSAKTMFVMRLVQLSAVVGEKVLVFSELLAPLDVLERMLGRARGWRKGKEILRIEGETAMEERVRVIERVNEDEGVKVLLASIMTCGEGVSLVGTSRVVFLDVHWNPAKLRQAVSRAFRMGQKRKVIAYRLVAAPEFDKCIRVCKKEWMARQVFENVGASSASSHSPFSHFLRHEPHPELLDPFFESSLLLHGVVDCFRLDTTLN